MKPRLCFLLLSLKDTSLPSALPLPHFTHSPF